MNGNSTATLNTRDGGFFTTKFIEDNQKLREEKALKIAADRISRKKEKKAKDQTTLVNKVFPLLRKLQGKLKGVESGTSRCQKARAYIAAAKEGKKKVFNGTNLVDISKYLHIDHHRGKRDDLPTADDVSKPDLRIKASIKVLVEHGLDKVMDLDLSGVRVGIATPAGMISDTAPNILASTPPRSNTSSSHSSASRASHMSVESPGVLRRSRRSGRAATRYGPPAVLDLDDEESDAESGEFDDGGDDSDYGF